MQGKVPEFITGDMQLAFTINKEKTSDPFPIKDSNYKGKSVECEGQVTAHWDNENWGLLIDTNPNNTNKIKCVIDFEVTLSNYIIAKAKYDESIEKQTHDATDQTGSDATTDYRYIGATPNNYVCLENDGECSDDELYRIIGVIPTQKDAEGAYENRVKLIKNTSYGEYIWTGSTDNQSNDWTKSTLNKETLNQTYWEKISDYHQYIDPAKWYLGGGVWTGTVTDYYKNERSYENIIANVALLYASDYSYATSGGSDGKSRDDCLNQQSIQWKNEYYSCNENDWLHSSTESKWTLDRSGTTAAYVVFNQNISQIGGLNGFNVYENGQNTQVYPTIYLKGEVKYRSGTGEKTNPYKVTIES